MIRLIQQDQLSIAVFKSREEMGAAAAAAGAAILSGLLSLQREANAMFAAAPSQNELLESLSRDRSIPFERIRGFHMDEYVGLSKDAPQGFGNFLRNRLFSRVPFGSVHYIDGRNEAKTACASYAALLRTYPLDICFMGIGENGHLAFNDPGTADFGDKELVKLVELEETCRLQQVHDGCFESLPQVPTHAITVTIPVLMASRHIVCTVPAATKAYAVRRMLQGPVSAECPASILRTHPHATLFLDADSAQFIL